MSLVSFLSSLELGLAETKLVLSSLVIIYVGSHSSLRRPHSASPKKIDKGSDGKKEREIEKENAPEGLSPKDAIMFPLMAATVLIGLYYLIQYLQDPDILNKIMRTYLSVMAVGGLTTFFRDTFVFASSFVFPSHWRRREGNTHRVYTVCSKTNEHVSIDGNGVRHTCQMPYGPLPMSWLPIPASKGLSSGLWSLYRLIRGEFTWRLKIYPFVDESILTTIHGPLGFILALGIVYLYYLTRSPMVGNVMGVAFCYSSNFLISPTSFPTGALILLGLFFYDIVMVFYT
jgi:minor histocompatibility antigen H13